MSLIDLAAWAGLAARVTALEAQSVLNPPTGGNFGGIGPPYPEPPSPAFLGSALGDFSVNSAAVDMGYPDKSLVLRTGATVNGPGSYKGTGTGNKSILGLFGFNAMPLSSLTSISFTWSNVVGPAGPNYNPPAAATTNTPYINLIVDFKPVGGGSDLRVLVLISDQLAPAIGAAIGDYTNPGGLNVLTYQWDSLKDVLIVNAPPNPVPGGVVPHVSVGPGWLENSYSWSALVAANPAAVLVDAYPDDGGLPAGAVMPAILLVSGDSGNVTRSGKRISALLVNGLSVLG